MQPNEARRRLQAGFSLIELTFVLMLVGIIGGIAIPPMMGAVRAQRLDLAAQQVLGDLNRARLEALKRNQSVTLKKTSSRTYTIEFVGARELPDGTTFGAGADSVRFASFGPTLTGAANVRVEAAGKTRLIRINGSGFARLQ